VVVVISVVVVVISVVVVICVVVVVNVSVVVFVVEVSAVVSVGVVVNDAVVVLVVVVVVVGAPPSQNFPFGSLSQCPILLHTTTPVLVPLHTNIHIVPVSTGYPGVLGG